MIKATGRIRLVVDGKLKEETSYNYAYERNNVLRIWGDECDKLDKQCWVDIVPDIYDEEGEKVVEEKEEVIEKKRNQYNHVAMKKYAAKTWKQPTGVRYSGYR